MAKNTYMGDHAEYSKGDGMWEKDCHTSESECGEQ